MRTLAAADPVSKKTSSAAILQAISNATTFNLTRIKALIKASDLCLAEAFLTKLIDLN